MHQPTTRSTPTGIWRNLAPGPLILGALAAFAWLALPGSVHGASPGTPDASTTSTTSTSGAALVTTSRSRWEHSPHGEMLKRILPPNVEPAGLPEPRSRGAQLTVQYCVQCHNLAPPAMHHAEKWPRIVARMLPRMQGKGNRGPLMKELMDGVSAPSEEETKVIVAYLQKHSQKPVDAMALPEANRTRVWQSYVNACNQCHTLPDPQRHTRAEWPRVVARMEQNMAWMNRVVGSNVDPREPQYRSDEIVAYLQRYARR